MQLPNHLPHPRRWILAHTLVPACATGLLWVSSPYQVTLAQAVAAFLLAWMPWTSYCHWKGGDRQGVPLFTFISGMYWIAYALPLFWGSREIGLIYGTDHLPPDAITASLWLVVLGVTVLWAGMAAASRALWVPKTRIDISQTGADWQYLRIVFLAVIAVRILFPITALGAGGRQILANLETIVPAAIFAILLRQYLGRQATDMDKLLIFGYALLGVAMGMSSGWLGSFVGLGVVAVVAYVYERRRLPAAAIFLLVPAVLFFQPAKGNFRQHYWERDSSAGYGERAFYWVSESWRMWSGAFSDSSGQEIQSMLQESLDRLSLLQQTAHVLDMTPSRVPYQYGKLYSYIGVTFIPRFLWPDKPSMNDANQWYQVTYGLTAPDSLSSVSIAVGSLAESYISFGWLGPLFIMFPFGYFLGSMQRVVLRVEAGLLFSCVGAALVPQFLAVESQMAQYVAGLAQQILVAVLVLLPVLKLRASAKRRRIPAYSNSLNVLGRRDSLLESPAPPRP